MSLRPLYLEQGRSWNVAIQDSVLRVAALGRAPSWYPLTRLSRVVSANDAQWSTAALLGCLGAGVPVQFMDGFGRLQACCYGTRRRETNLTGLLIEAIEREDWDNRFAIWQQGVCSQMIRDALLNARLPLLHVEPQSARSDLCNNHRRRLGKPVGRLLTRLEGAAHAFTSQCLESELADPWLLGHPRPGLCLVSVFAGLMQWPLHRLIPHAPASDDDTRSTARLAADLFEANRQPMRDELANLLSRFELWLRNWVL